MTTLDEWTERLVRAAISERDRRAIAASESARQMVLERLESAVEDHDALHGWAVVGRVLADESASPSLVAEVVDALVAASPRAPEGWAPPARAAIIEAFVAAQREIEAERVKDAWRFPRCVVRLDESTAAVGIRRVHAEGTARARTALADALSVAGIDLAQMPPKPSRASR